MKLFVASVLLCMMYSLSLVSMQSVGDVIAQEVEPLVYDNYLMGTDQPVLRTVCCGDVMFIHVCDSRVQMDFGREQVRAMLVTTEKAYILNLGGDKIMYFSYEDGRKGTYWDPREIRPDNAAYKRTVTE